MIYINWTEATINIEDAEVKMKQEVMLNTWPDSQACCGCKHGCLVDCDEHNIPSAYICFEKFSPDGKGENGCSQYKDEVERS